jgi:hypothetical protein
MEDGSHFEDPPQFMRESVDLAILVESIFVSPDAPGWAASAVRSLVAEVLPSVSVPHSDLRSDPII